VLDAGVIRGVTGSAIRQEEARARLPLRRPALADCLVVRGGIFGNRVEVVRTAWIEGIKPREMAISVRERLAA